MQKNLWWHKGIVYQIYPRSFADSNQDGIGYLNGIIQKLDYLKDLGVDAIWLSPIYPSPDVDFGYDVSNYVDIDPRMGTIEDFKHLLDAAHQRGIHIILDLVLNHTSNQHPWFKEALKSKDNPYRDWYIWRDPAPNGKEPNNWQSIFGGNAWEFDPQSGQYYYHMFYKEQPDVNWRNPQVRKAMLDVFRFWLELGVDGFRLDVFNLYYKHPEMPDNPTKFGIRGFDRQTHIYDTDQPEMFDLLAEIRQLLDSYPERYAIGETFLSTAEKAASYSGDDKLHAAFNFIFLHGPWRAEHFTRSIEEWEKALAGNTWPTYVLNNHDVIRSATRYCKNEDDARLKTAAVLLLTLRGTPYLYYGEEIGMRDVSVRRSQIQDPIGKRFWPFYKGRDGCRSPMQWDHSQYAGFSSSEPWLPVHPNYKKRNVRRLMEDEFSLLNFYKNLIRIRRKHAALHSGSFKIINQASEHILAYLRQVEQEKVLVAINFSSQAQKLELEPATETLPWKVLLSTEHRVSMETETSLFLLAPNEACIYIQQYEPGSD